MKRIGDSYGIQFDAPLDDVTISEGTEDAPPFVSGFRVTSTHGKGVLNISFGPEERPSAGGAAAERDAVFSDRVVKRNIFDSRRQVIGEDTWGQIKSGERWRRMHLRGSVYANYGFANKTDSAIFDRIMNSACFPSTSDIDHK